MDHYLIGIDIGTQGTKAILFDTRMSILAEAFEASRLVSPKPGVVWQEADEIYMSCVRTVAEIVGKSGIDPMRVAAIGIDGQMAGIMGVDRDGEASTYYDSWLDMRCGKYMQGMRERAGKRVVEVTGGPITYTALKYCGGRTNIRRLMQKPANLFCRTDMLPAK
jgi:xylulokinase